MTKAEWIMIAAIILGPILAVQAQKWIERARERRNQKLWIFRTLMATRGERTSVDHFQALNMIDLAFYGRKILWFNYRTKNEKSVRDLWKEYLDLLNTSPKQISNVADQRSEKFIDLLHMMARSVGYDFDKVDLKRAHYLPHGYARKIELEEETQKLWVEVLNGTKSLKCELVRSEQDEVEALIK